MTFQIIKYFNSVKTDRPNPEPLTTVAAADKHAVHSILLVTALMFIGLLLIGSPSTWMTLTIAGLAMGMMIFIMTSGFTLVFGLMDVLNFGHGAFISLGAFMGITVFSFADPWLEVPSFTSDIFTLICALVISGIVVGLFSFVFEKVIIRHVYGNHLKQILITTGGLIIVEQVIHVVWGSEEITILRPESFQGSFVVGDFVFEKFRLLAVVFGMSLFVGLLWLFNKTRLGLVIRAGVEDKEMVKALGFDVEKVFVYVFVGGSALAGFGGVLWGMYEEVVTAYIGQELMITVFIVAIIGGLGSIEGCFIAALLVGLLSNYVGFLFPKLALFSTVLLMVAVLFWRPNGLIPVSKGVS